MLKDKRKDRWRDDRWTFGRVELLTLPEHLSSPPVFSWVCVTRSLVLCVCFVDRYLPCCNFSFGHCFVCSFSIFGFWLPLWYLQTLLNTIHLMTSKYIWVFFVYIYVFEVGEISYQSLTFSFKFPSNSSLNRPHYTLFWPKTWVLLSHEANFECFSYLLEKLGDNN